MEPKLSTNQEFHMILADIAMAAAIKTYDADYAFPASEAYRPGSIRDGWFGSNTDALLTRQVTAMANAAAGSLQGQDADQLAATAERYGVPLTAEHVGRIVEHFINRREAVLTYNK